MAFIRNKNTREVFKPTGENVGNYSMTIYNRWGEKLFETHSFSQGWDGTFQGRDVEEGVYVYVIRYSGFHSSQKVLSGNITLLR